MGYAGLLKARNKALFAGIFAIASVFVTDAFAAQQIPPCFAYGVAIPVNNDKVLQWKRSTPNQFEERAHVRGVVVDVFPDRNGHEHFEIAIGPRGDDVIEVVFNQHFGEVPLVRVGMEAIACGDYITSTAQSGPYPPSPSGAIIHWLHMNPKGRGHEAGFMVLDGVLYGWAPPKGGNGPRKPRNPRRPR